MFTSDFAHLRVKMCFKTPGTFSDKNMFWSTEKLNTLFCEVEAVVNSRPLTYLSDDPGECEALTPNHLLLLKSRSEPLHPDCSKADTYRRRWKHVQVLADLFWKRWRQEYLPSLMLRQKWIDPERNFSIGDLVLLVDENAPRKTWPLGRILQIIPGQDGLVRTVEVKVQHGSLVRPVTKLCLLEAVDKISAVKEDSKEESTER